MRNVRATIVIAMLLSVFAVSVCFGKTAVGRQATEKVTCLVKVVDAKGRAVDGAEVAACENFYHYSEGWRRTELVDKIRRTDSDGNCILNLDVTNRHNVYIVARKKGLALDCRRLPQHTFVAKLTIMLDEPLVLAGTVVDETGKGISEAKVVVIVGKLINVGLSEPEDWFVTKTDVKGQFSFENIPADAMAEFLVEAPGRASVYTFMASDRLPCFRFSGGERDIRLVLPPEAKIEGRVLDDSGKGVGGIKVLARPNKGAGNYYTPELAVSGTDGRFCLKGLVAGEYSLQVALVPKEMADWVARKDIKVFAKAGRTTSGVIMRVSKGGLLDVVVREASTKEPLGDVWVGVSKKARFGRHPSFYGTARTGKDGIACIRAPVGRCQISVGGAGHSLARDLSVTVVKGKTTRFRVRLDRDPLVSGVVVDEAGRPIEGAEVTAKLARDATVSTDASGKFELGVSWIGNGPRFVFARDIQRNVSGVIQIKNEAGAVNIKLKPALILSGRVADPDGIPIPAAKVQLLVHVQQGGYSWVGAEAVTDVEGYYKIPAVAPAKKGFEYCVNVEAIGYGPLRYERISLTEDSENRVELETYILQPANLSITGVVVDARGKAVANKAVIADNVSGGPGQPKRIVATDEDGRFFINRVCKGLVRLQVGWASDRKYRFFETVGGAKDVKIVLGQDTNRKTERK